MDDVRAAAPVTVSAAVAYGRVGGDAATALQRLLTTAEDLLAQAKERGGNCLVASEVK